FPGNVRELENIVQRAVVLTRGDTISTRDLPPNITAVTTSPARVSGELTELGDLNQRVESLERILIDKALEKSNGNQVKAAEILGISERTLRYKIAKRRE
ncbi:MAG: helix-turn-helix domain-containing protein, partial [Bacteroidota bacterium]